MIRVRNLVVREANTLAIKAAIVEKAPKILS